MKLTKLIGDTPAKYSIVRVQFSMPGCISASGKPQGISAEKNIIARKLPKCG
jgi:hypothetical protein